MATNNNSARQTHVSPGIYTKETDLTYAVKSLGITTLGLVGETVKGPAFQPLLIENWNQFTNYFGGTNPSQFKGSGYLKYEAPYIAKSYLRQSNQLYVTRVLGLSGYNAGPAWAITAYAPAGKDGKDMLIAILRSRGEYQKTAFVSTATEEQCEDVYEYDKLVYYVSDVDNVSLVPSKTFNLGSGCDKFFGVTTDPSGDSYFNVSQINYGKFTISGTTDKGMTFSYAVSLNPGDKNYIINVLGTQQDVGDTELYVEELYDVALVQLIESGDITGINKQMVGFPPIKVTPAYASCNDLLLEDEQLLTKRDIGKRFLATQDSINPEIKKMWNVHKTTDNGVSYVVTPAVAGNIYQVISFVTTAGTREYYYNETGEKLGAATPDEQNVLTEAVEVLSDNLFYVKDGKNINPITCDLNNYKEQYRFASTPWIVSELKGDAQNVELVKLFRFHTISDGNASNIQIKVSIENIKPDDGLFDVVIRSFYDTDSSPVVLERYGKCNLVPGTANYIGLKIGTSDGNYVTKSNYVTVEVNENDRVKSSIPCGFLGYPVRDYSGLVPGNGVTGTVKQPLLQYNVNIDEDIRAKKQYFGLSNLVGIDEDILSYKGVEAYNGLPQGLTPSFHLDSRLISKEDLSTGTTGFTQVVTVDGETGYTWVTVNRNNVTSEGIEPRIGTDALMQGTIYEDINYRKFTVLPYGGFDGWDVYRTSRTITDDFKYNKYKGSINTKSGVGANFSIINDPVAYNFDSGTKAITSDWYAYLSAIRTFANPKTIDINVLATPGIDYVNNQMLVEEVISMIEDERADSVYVVTTPDKPFGASDSVSDMFTPDEAVSNLEETGIDSNYTCSYYPNIQYFDADNNVYVYLPPTKDVVRNFALTDNTAYPWFAPAGWDRGAIDGVKPKKTLKLDEQDTLYAGGLNFVQSFAQEGFRLWGQKNFQIADTQMNRIATRRLLLQLRKLISIACIKLIFEPNDNTTKETFKSLVNPILENVFNNRGISDFRIDVDDSVEARDRHELPAKIWIKPIGALEYIDINFMITPEGASFDDY